MTPRWILEHERAERARVATAPMRRDLADLQLGRDDYQRPVESKAERIARAHTLYPQLMRRLAACMSPDSTIDTEHHAASIALTVGPLTRNTTAASTETLQGLEGAGRKEAC